MLSYSHEWVRAVPDSQLENMWGLVSGGFSRLNSKTLIRQSPTRGELDKLLLDEDVMKYIATSSSGEPVQLSTLHTTPASVEWVESDFLENVFERSIARGVFRYIGITVVDGRSQEYCEGQQHVLGFARDVSSALLTEGHVADIGFDHASKNPALPRLLHKYFQVISQNYSIVETGRSYVGVADAVRYPSAELRSMSVVSEDSINKDVLARVLKSAGIDLGVVLSSGSQPESPHVLGIESAVYSRIYSDSSQIM